jgi:hypothetical protein
VWGAPGLRAARPGRNQTGTAQRGDHVAADGGAENLRDVRSAPLPEDLRSALGLDRLEDAGLIGTLTKDETRILCWSDDATVRLRRRDRRADRNRCRRISSPV